MGIQPSRVLLAVLCGVIAASAFAQTVIGPESAPARYNRLSDYAARPSSAVTPASPDVFGTAAVGAGVTFYDARFRRVSEADRADPAVLALAATIRGLPAAEQLARVQREVLARVRWSHDLDNMRVADFWSNAGETLRRGSGDSEDIAIVQMQVLKAAGYNPRDLYISIGRQRPVGAHIVMLARTQSGFVKLDDRVGHPVDAGRDRAFTPVLTVGQGKSWIHGRRVGAISAAAGAH